VDDVVNRVKRRCPIRLGFEPLPKLFDRVNPTTPFILDLIGRPL